MSAAAVSGARSVPAAERLLSLAALARLQGVLVIDGMAGLWTDPLMMADDFHPNDAGYKVMCDRILQELGEHYP